MESGTKGLMENYIIDRVRVGDGDRKDRGVVCTKWTEPHH